MIVYKMLADGAFVAGDTETGRTCYAYPTSSHATLARKMPERIAADMVASANRDNSPKHIRDHYDARNFASINA
jgi:hypothetical protein